LPGDDPIIAPIRGGWLFIDPGAIGLKKPAAHLKWAAGALDIQASAARASAMRMQPANGF
jgi:hypothetical protein